MRSDWRASGHFPDRTQPNSVSRGKAKRALKVVRSSPRLPPCLLHAALLSATATAGVAPQGLLATAAAAAAAAALLLSTAAHAAGHSPPRVLCRCALSCHLRLRAMSDQMEVGSILKKQGEKKGRSKGSIRKKEGWQFKG
ncbi:hypothetical protein NL676_014725 [Syzygium grande]|nr:hypothetical protein NL676_014725 [Syzygium grande]